jgi:transcription termination factor Rho
VASSTRREELGPEVLVVVRALRQRIAAMSPASALGDVLSELKATSSNEELIRKLGAAEARRA